MPGKVSRRQFVHECFTLEFVCDPSRPVGLIMRDAHRSGPLVSGDVTFIRDVLMEVSPQMWVRRSNYIVPVSVLSIRSIQF